MLTDFAHIDGAMLKQWESGPYSEQLHQDFNLRIQQIIFFFTPQNIYFPPVIKESFVGQICLYVSAVLQA